MYSSDFANRVRVLAALPAEARDAAERVIDAILLAKAYHARCDRQGLGWSEDQEEAYWNGEAQMREMYAWQMERAREEYELDEKDREYYEEMNRHYHREWLQEKSRVNEEIVAKAWDEIADGLERGSYPAHFRPAAHKDARYGRSVKYRHKPKAKRGVFRFPRPVHKRDRMRDLPETMPGKHAA